MIFYGTKAANLKTGQIRNITCPHCNENSAFTYSVYGKYVHIYWIPFFPIKKITIAECQHCKASYDYKDLNQGAKTRFEREGIISSVKTPVWHFSWAIVFGIIVCYAFYSGIKSNQNTADFAKNPKVGDRYKFECRKGQYSLMKVDKVTKDSVFVTQNKMEIEKKSQVDDLDKPENYSADFKVAYTKKEIISMQAKDSIFEIER